MTNVLSIFDANSLNLRTDVAQTDVSRLGKIFNTKRFPFKSQQFNSLKSDFTKLKHGALLPTLGKSPLVETGLPLNVIFAIL